MDYLKYIYFDTNVLIQNNWPQLSAKLIKCLQWANAMDKKVFLPSVVEQELEVKWLALFDEKYAELESSIKDMNKQLCGNKLRELALPNRAVELEEYRKKVQSLKESYILELIGRPQIDKEVLIDMAVSYDPPFEEGDKGFKDTIILFSVFEHLQKMGSKGGSIIARDHIFHDKKILELAKKQGLRLKVIKSVDQLWVALERIINDVIRDAYRLEQKRATLALETINDKIEKFILENIGFNMVDFYTMGDKVGGEIVGIDKLEVGKIKNVTAAGFKDIFTRGTKGGRVPISFDVEIKMYLDVIKQTSTSPLFATSVKVGEPVPTPRYRALMEVFTKEKSEPIRTTETLDLDVLVEATSEIINDEYKNIELISVKPRIVS